MIWISIDLTNYAVDTKGNGVNTIVVIDSLTLTGGTGWLVPKRNFGTTFHAWFDDKSKPAVWSSDWPNSFEVRVTAWDDLKDGKSQGFSFDYQTWVMPCKATPTTTTAPPTTTMPTDSTTTEQHQVAQDRHVALGEGRPKVSRQAMS